MESAIFHISDIRGLDPNLGSGHTVHHHVCITHRPLLTQILFKSEKLFESKITCFRTTHNKQISSFMILSFYLLITTVNNKTCALLLQYVKYNKLWMMPIYVFSVYSRPYILTVALMLQCCVSLSSPSPSSVCLSSVTLCIVVKRCVPEQKLLLTAYTKSYMKNRLAPK